MKKQLYLPVIILLSAISISCEEDFNPKGELKNLYVLNCIIKMTNYPGSFDASMKTIISRTYDKDGFIPLKPDSSLFVPRADVSFFQFAKEFKLCDSSGTSRFDKYWIIGAQPRFIGNDRCKIEATVPDGVKLTAETTTPRPISFTLSRTFNHGITAVVNQFYWGSALTISWGDPVVSNHLFFPKFTISAKSISANKSFDVEIPTKYLKRDDKYAPVFPGAINLPYVSYEYSAIDSAMKSIAGAGYRPDDIKIERCYFQVVEFDRNLSAFYSSTNGYMDSYSIRLDENIFSNVKGGLGIFGSYMINLETYTMDADYVKSFGYNSYKDQ